MVATLMKYEFLRTRRWLAVITVFATLLTVVGTLLAWTGWPVISALGVMMALISVGAYLTVIQLGLTFDYWRSSYSKIGYFTQTLPVKGTTIYWCKLLWGCMVTIVAAVWNVVLGLVAYLGVATLAGNTQPLTALKETLMDIFQVISPLGLGGITVAILLFWFTGLAHYYFAASFGSEAWINRLGIGGPIVVLVGVYLLVQLILFLGIILIPLGLEVTAGGAKVVWTSFLQVVASSQDPAMIPLGFVPVMVLVTALLIWRTVRSWKHKVSLA